MPERSPVACGGSSASSVRNCSRDANCSAMRSSCSEIAGAHLRAARICARGAARTTRARATCPCPRRPRALPSEHRGSTVQPRQPRPARSSARPARRAAGLESREAARRRWPAPRRAGAAARGRRRCGSSGCRPSAARASISLTCAASRNLRPPYFTYGMFRRTELELEHIAVMRVAEQHRLVPAAARRARAFAARARPRIPPAPDRRPRSRSAGAPVPRRRAVSFELQRCLADQRVRRIEDRLRGAVVLLERDDACRARTALRNPRMFSTVAARNE